MKLPMQATQTIAECVQALNEGRTSAQVLVEEILEKIEAADGEGSRVFTRVFPAQARAAARASDLLRNAGIPRSVLEGIPVSVKDLFDVAGEVTLAGSVIRQSAPAASEDADVVRLLRAAGAIIIGCTNMTEFAYSGLGINPHYGTPANPWDRASRRIPGGSSSGAAISVSDHMALGAIGSDTGGSVRIPAALCGLTGFKPTARRISMRGAFPLSSALDSIGPIAPSVDCCALLDGILSGDRAQTTARIEHARIRLAIPDTLVMDDLAPHVAAMFQRAVSRLSEAGVQIRELSLPEFGTLASINAKGGFAAAEAWHTHRANIALARERFDPRVLSRILRGSDMSAADWLELKAARSAWITRVNAATADYDALIMPTVPLTAPTIAELEASDDAYFRTNGLMLRNPSIINFWDGCALSLPCHEPETAPVGLMIAGAAMKDSRILAIGRAIEKTIGPR